MTFKDLRFSKRLSQVVSAPGLQSFFYTLNSSMMLVWRGVLHCVFLIQIWMIIPGCADKGCSGFRHLENGRTFFRYGGLYVTFTCHSGFRIHGHRTSSCVSGQWARSPPLCVASGCPSPGDLLHGSTLMSHDRSLAFFRCDPGFNLFGSALLYCKGKNWNGTKPVCRVADIMNGHLMQESLHEGPNAPVNLKVAVTAPKEFFLKSTLLGVPHITPEFTEDKQERFRQTLEKKLLKPWSEKNLKSDKGRTDVFKEPQSDLELQKSLLVPSSNETTISDPARTYHESSSFKPWSEETSTHDKERTDVLKEPQSNLEKTKEPANLDLQKFILVPSFNETTISNLTSTYRESSSLKSWSDKTLTRDMERTEVLKESQSELKNTKDLANLDLQKSLLVPSSTISDLASSYRESSSFKSWSNKTLTRDMVRIDVLKEPQSNHENAKEPISNLDLQKSLLVPSSNVTIISDLTSTYESSSLKSPFEKTLTRDKERTDVSKEQQSHHENAKEPISNLDLPKTFPVPSFNVTSIPDLTSTFHESSSFKSWSDKTLTLDMERTDVLNEPQSNLENAKEPIINLDLQTSLLVPSSNATIISDLTSTFHESSSFKSWSERTLTSEREITDVLKEPQSNLENAKEPIINLDLQKSLLVPSSTISDLVSTYRESSSLNPTTIFSTPLIKKLTTKIMDQSFSATFGTDESSQKTPVTSATEASPAYISTVSYSTTFAPNINTIGTNPDLIQSGVFHAKDSHEATTESSVTSNSFGFMESKAVFSINYLESTSQSTLSSSCRGLCDQRPELQGTSLRSSERISPSPEALTVTTQLVSELPLKGATTVDSKNVSSKTTVKSVLSQFLKNSSFTSTHYHQGNEKSDHSDPKQTLESPAWKDLKIPRFPIRKFRPMCLYPPLPSHGTFYFRSIKNPAPFQYKHYIQYACYSGYTLTNGDVYSYCQPNGQWSGKTPQCLALTPCSLNNGGCSQICQENGQNRAQCLCKPGFLLLEDQRTCRDLDECVEQLHLCQQVCENTLGSYRCNCNPGFQLSTDRTSCTDMKEYKECEEMLDETQLHRCEWKCVNLPGTHRCICPRGYRLHLNGYQCEDMNECELNNAGCSHFCINRRGSYKCACPETHQISPYNRKHCQPIQTHTSYSQ